MFPLRIGVMTEAADSKTVGAVLLSTLGPMHGAFTPCAPARSLRMSRRWMHRGRERDNRPQPGAVLATRARRLVVDSNGTETGSIARRDTATRWAFQGPTEFGLAHFVCDQADRPRQGPVRHHASASCQGGIGERRSNPATFRFTPRRNIVGQRGSGRCDGRTALFQHSSPPYRRECACFGVASNGCKRLCQCA